MIRIAIAAFLLFATPILTFSQGSITGSLQTTTKWFMRDSLIDATGTPQYDNQLVGSFGWLTTNYTNREWNLDAGLRLDYFHNSDLQNPTESFSGAGIGRWYIKKRINELTITGGYIYDQIGNGIIFRSYEARPLAIDNALFGVQVQYDFNDNWFIKGFTGQMKNRFERYDPIIRGIQVEGFHKIGKQVTIAPGMGVVNRTLDNNSMALIVSNIEALPVEDRFVPRFNNYAFTFYNRMNYKNLSWFVEVSAKSKEAIVNADDQLVNSDGTNALTMLTYSTRGLGITAQYKRTENFVLRTSPNETILDGLINFLPPMARQNTYMLTARYNAATQFLGEQAYQIDFVAKPNRQWAFSGTFSDIRNLNNDVLFRELYLESVYKKGRDLKLTVGGQMVQYNQLVYETKGDSQLVSIVPFVEMTYRFNRKTSIRTELQYMNNQEDFGSWAYGLVEVSVAPNWSFGAWDMWNIQPKKTTKALHYPTTWITYQGGANRFEIAYVKQVEGIVCTGGICRFEPAFSGVRFTLNSTF